MKVPLTDAALPSRRTLRMSLLMLALLSAPTWAGTVPVEQQIAQLEDGFNTSYAANDLAKYFSYYADDVVLLFPEGRTDLATYRRDWTALVQGGTVIDGLKLSDMTIRPSPAGDAVTASYALDVGTRLPDGQLLHDRYLETDVWWLRDGSWHVAHVHYAKLPEAPKQ